jgi:hypothetical protein
MYWYMMQLTIQKNSALFVNIAHLFHGCGRHVSLFIFTVRNVLALDLNLSQEAGVQRRRQCLKYRVAT